MKENRFLLLLTDNTARRQRARTEDLVPLTDPQSGVPVYTPEPIAGSQAAAVYFDRGQPISLSLGNDVAQEDCGCVCHEGTPARAHAFGQEPDGEADCGAVTSQASTAHSLSQEADGEGDCGASITSTSASFTAAAEKVIEPDCGSMPSASNPTMARAKTAVQAPAKAAPATPAPSAAAPVRPDSPPPQEEAGPPPAPAAPTTSPVVEDAILADIPETASEDRRFEEDLRRILSGEGPRPAAPNRPAPGAGPSGKDHAIFEKIAQNMQLATAYDLGAISLEQKFDSFEADMEEEEAPAAKTVVSVAPKAAAEAPSPEPPQDSVADFLADIDQIKGKQPAASIATPAPPPAASENADRAAGTTQDAESSTSHLVENQEEDEDDEGATGTSGASLTNA